MDIEKNKLHLLDEKIKQLQNQKKAMLQREKEKERKARTKRLIQLGAIVEKELNLTGIPLKQQELIIKAIAASPDLKKAINFD